MKKFFAVLLAALLMVGFVACGGTEKPAEEKPVEEQGTEAPVEEEQPAESEKKVLIMATEPTFPPYNYMKGTDVVGIDTDIAMEIAQEHGWELKIEPMDFDAIIPSVKTGKADFGAAGISVTPERLEQVDFTVEYATSVQVILIRGEDQETIKNIDDLNGKKVGVQLGTVSDLVIQDDYPEIELVPNKKYTDLILELNNGKIDAIVLDNLPAQSFLSKNPDLALAEEEFFTDSYAFAVSKDNPELLAALNSSLERLMEEGKIQEFTTYHLGD